MKTITVSVDDAVYQAASTKAAESNTSVSTLVQNYLTSLGKAESDFARRKRLQKETIASIGRFQASTRLSRDEIHDRHAVP